MQTAGLSDRELVPWVVVVVVVVVETLLFSHDSISEPRLCDQIRFLKANSIALDAASPAAPISLLITNFKNCQD